MYNIEQYSVLQKPVRYLSPHPPTHHRQPRQLRTCLLCMPGANTSQTIKTHLFQKSVYALGKEIRKEPHPLIAMGIIRQDNDIHIAFYWVLPACVQVN
ncbi:hypothetical protein [Microbacter margulisiae]|uniref:Uncharacterized protein n=1 Tax=Microbacter margulisiae TaxID=1350067 RepID=A0A7W5DNW0_9PORP|nr:hypothetical protein [Microbacter margulisiae]MBB3186008.1 hypothetical protein [Microbacter margulisiae]